VRGHVVLDEQRGAFNPAHDIRLVAADVEIAVADLAVVFLAHGVIALTHVGGDVNVVRKVRNREVDRIHGRPHFVIVGHREQRLVDLDMFAARRGEHLEIVA